MGSNMCQENMRNDIDLSRATNIAMGNGAFAFMGMEKSLDGVGGIFSNKGIDVSFISFGRYTHKVSR